MRTVCLQFCARQGEGGRVRDGEALCLCNCRDCHLQLEGEEIGQAIFNFNVQRRTMLGRDEAVVAVVIEIEMLRLKEIRFVLSSSRKLPSLLPQ